jgi:hypothetical protein
MLYPEMFDDVLGFHDRATECVAAVPVPVKVTVVSGVCASLVNVSIVDWTPFVVGLNLIVNEALFPAAIVCGSESPFRVNAELPVFAAEMVTLLSFAVRVAVAVPLDPSTTSPTAIVAGEIVKVPRVGGPLGALTP